MMKFQQKGLLALLFVAVVLVGGLKAQNKKIAPSPNNPDPEVTIHPLQQIQLDRQVDLTKASSEDWWQHMKNTRKIHEPGVDIDKDAYREIKRKANEERQNATKEAGSSLGSVNKTSGTNANPPVLGDNWYANPYDGGIPNDNDIAVGDGGKVISVTNSQVRIYKVSGGAACLQQSLQAFGGAGSGTGSKFDPKVVYDNTRDRFIVVFLNGSTSTTSRIIVAFSAGPDPCGTWNVYAIDGNATGSVWTDFPQIAQTTDELFITGNMFSNSNQGQGTAIWQIDKQSGFDGATISTQLFTSSSFFSMHPVQGAMTLTGPNIYFIRNISSPFSATRTIYVHEITNTIGNNGVLNSPVLLNSNVSYRVPPDAEQQGTNQLLNTNECRVQTAYMENGLIEFAFNTGSNNKPAVYHGTVQLSPQGLGFSAVSGQILEIDSFDIGFPGIAYGGCYDPNTGKNTSVIGFNYCSDSHYPGNAVVYVDENGDFTAPTVCKAGFTYMGGGSGVYRWGDYFGSSNRTNNPGEVWVGGSIGIGSVTHDNATWISQVLTDCNNGLVSVPKEVEPEASMVAYPNPAVDIISFEFDVTESGVYNVKIYDLSGRVVKDLIEDKLSRGEAKVRFNTALLANGSYLAIVSGENGVIHRKKFAVAH